jgi:hypothetical protein
MSTLFKKLFFAVAVCLAGSSAQAMENVSWALDKARKLRFWSPSVFNKYLGSGVSSLLDWAGYCQAAYRGSVQGVKEANDLLREDLQTFLGKLSEIKSNGWSPRIEPSVLAFKKSVDQLNPADLQDIGVQVREDHFRNFVKNNQSSQSYRNFLQVGRNIAVSGTARYNIDVNLVIAYLFYQVHGGTKNKNLGAKPTPALAQLDDGLTHLPAGISAAASSFAGAIAVSQWHKYTTAPLVGWFAGKNPGWLKSLACMFLVEPATVLASHFVARKLYEKYAQPVTSRLRSFLSSW